MASTPRVLAYRTLAGELIDACLLDRQTLDHAVASISANDVRPVAHAVTRIVRDLLAADTADLDDTDLLRSVLDLLSSLIDQLDPDLGVELSTAKILDGDRLRIDLSEVQPSVARAAETMLAAHVAGRDRELSTALLQVADTCVGPVAAELWGHVSRVLAEIEDDIRARDALRMVARTAAWTLDNIDTLDEFRWLPGEP
jgi:hypothetical protein